MDSGYLLACYAFIPFGPQRLKLLINYFKTVKGVWNASRDELLEVGLKAKVVDEFIKHRENFDIEQYLVKLKKNGIGFVNYKDDNYPENLKDLDNAPLVLYFKGELKKSDADAIAIVGSRKMTSYGKEVAFNFANQLSSLGITIVSGLARGIDTIAHMGALDAGGRTIAVLGCGIDIVYPPENIGLYKSIIAKGGAVISEYPLSYPALRINFANRNRIISGLSKAVIVVEGLAKSGTLLTASHAAEQGRTVFATPGQIFSPLSQAPHFLIKNGAKIAFSVNDIVEELDLQVKVNKEEFAKIMPADDLEAKLMDVLENEPLHLDEIVRCSGLKVADINAKLTIMQLKGMVKNIGEGIYKKC